jgi:hypothetical protein
MERQWLTKLKNRVELYTGWLQEWIKDLPGQVR